MGTTSHTANGCDKSYNRSKKASIKNLSLMAGERQRMPSVMGRIMGGIHRHKTHNKQYQCTEQTGT